MGDKVNMGQAIDKHTQLPNINLLKTGPSKCQVLTGSDRLPFFKIPKRL